MNDFIASLYDPWFNYELYKELQDSVYNAFDFQKLGISLAVISALFLFVFYKLWDPVKKPLLKWGLILVAVGIVMFATTYGLLISNGELLIIDNPSPQYFVLQMAAISFLYGVILSALLSILFKYISTGNKYNPF